MDEEIFWRDEKVLSAGGHMCVKGCQVIDMYTDNVNFSECLSLSLLRLFYVHRCFYCMFVLCVHAVSLRARSGHQILWNGVNQMAVEPPNRC